MAHPRQLLLVWFTLRRSGEHLRPASFAVVTERLGESVHLRGQLGDGSVAGRVFAARRPVDRAMASQFGVRRGLRPWNHPSDERMSDAARYGAATARALLRRLWPRIGRDRGSHPPPDPPEA